MKKRFIILLSCLIMIATIFSACGKSTEEVKTEEPAKTGQTTETEKAADTVTIKYYNWDNETMANTTKALIEQFEQANPNIKVESVSLVPGNSVDTLKKLDVVMSSGEAIDVMLFPNIDETLARASQGVLAPLDDFYAKDNVKPEDEYYVNPKAGGKYYASMYQRSLWFVMLNENALKEAGLSVPKLGWTWDDFRDYAKKMTKGEGNDKRFGTYFHGWGDYANPILFNEKKNPFLKEDGTTQYDDPSVLSFFNLRRAMEEQDKSARPYADVVGAKLAYRTEFFNEKAAMMVTGSWMVADTANTEQYPHTFKTAFAPVPLSSKDAELGMTSFGGQYMSIAQNSQHKEEAYKFIRFVTTNTSDAKKELSGWKKADDKKIIEATIGDKKDLFNLESLEAALFDPKLHSPGASEIAVSYGPQLKKILEDGFSKFILDKISAEDAQKYMVDESNKVIQENAGK